MDKTEPERSDEDIVRGIRRDGAQSFKTLYYRYAEILFRFLWRRTRNRDVAEDLVQEVFCRVWRHRINLDETRSIKSYLFKIAHHLAVDHLREDVREVAPISDPEDDRRPFTYQVEVAEAIARAIEHLSHMQRKVFCLSRFEGLKYAEIASVLEISIKTVEIHMGRALKKLRRELAEWQDLILIWVLA